MYWDFFQTLHMARQVGPNGPQPLSLSDIYALTKMMGIRKTDELEFVVRVIPMLDQIYLNKVYEEKEKSAKKNKSTTPPPRRRPRRR